MGLAPGSDALVTQLSSMLTGLGYTPRTFSSEADFESYIRDTNYQTFSQKICFGITVQSSAASNYQYKLRFNISNRVENSDGPAPTLKLTE